jgi:carbamoyltransferase
VHAETNPLYHALLERFLALTGCPVLVNTRCFMRTETDHLVIGSFVFDKARQPALADDDAWRAEFGLD